MDNKEMRGGIDSNSQPLNEVARAWVVGLASLLPTVLYWTVVLLWGGEFLPPTEMPIYSSLGIWVLLVVTCAFGTMSNSLMPAIVFVTEIIGSFVVLGWALAVTALIGMVLLYLGIFIGFIVYSNLSD